MLRDQRPRILCLHGGGVSAQIFQCQMRSFIKSLAPYFRLVFMNGPWESEMHPDLKPVYAHMGPTYRWAKWLSHHTQAEESMAVDEVEYCLEKAMEEDEGAGEWVGLLGFSQGAKLAFSILLENQLRQHDPWARPFTGVHWQFGIILAGRAPPYCLNPHARDSPYFSRLTQLSTASDEELFPGDLPPMLCTPTLHVHGLQDPGLDLHRDLLKTYSSPAHSTLVEWEGAHRIPFKTSDVRQITQSILKVASVSTTQPA